MVKDGLQSGLVLAASLLRLPDFVLLDCLFNLGLRLFSFLKILLSVLEFEDDLVSLQELLAILGTDVENKSENNEHLLKEFECHLANQDRLVLEAADDV